MYPFLQDGEENFFLSIAMVMSSGTSSPMDQYLCAFFPMIVFASHASRYISPALRWGSLYFFWMSSACVPLPDPWGPMR